MNWGEFAEQAPELAAEGEKRFDSSGVVFVGTLTKDGSPRISPVEPFVFEGLLLLGMMWQSKKALDLLRDPRCLVHNAISDRHGTDGEFKVRGRAQDVSDPEFRARFGEEVYRKINFRPPEPYHLFAVDIDSVALVTRDTKDQHVQRWP